MNMYAFYCIKSNTVMMHRLSHIIVIHSSNMSFHRVVVVKLDGLVALKLKNL